MRFVVNFIALFWVGIAKAAHPASWMSGKFGLGLRIGAGDWIERRDQNGWGLNWTALVDQFVSVGASWVIINLSEGAAGDRWMAYNPYLTDINAPPTTDCIPGLSVGDWGSECLTAVTPTSPDDGGKDYFRQMAEEFKREEIKVIVYVASEGPAKFKHGTTKAFDRQHTLRVRPGCIDTAPKNGPKACFEDPDNCCSIAMGNWIKSVKTMNLTDLDASFEPDSIDYPKLHAAYAKNIIGYYAKTYADYIDGWWFDHANEVGACSYGSSCPNDFIDKEMVRSFIRQYQRNVPISFNSCSNAQKVPLQICSEGLEDFTAGHPTPLKRGTTLPSSDINYPMVTSIEEGTRDGFFYSTNDWPSLGHIFMPTGTAWNGPTIPAVWTDPYPYDPSYSQFTEWSEGVTQTNGWNPNATDWMSRSLATGGAWTWNLPRASNSPNTYYLLHPNHLAVVKQATAALIEHANPATGNSNNLGSSGGDPHFKTWTGDRFDYHGECDLVLVDNPLFAKNLGLKLHIRTTRQHYYSYIERAALQIGSDVLEFSNSVDNILINGEIPLQENEKSLKLSGYEIRRFRKAISVRLSNRAKAKIDFMQRRNGMMGIVVDGGSTNIFQGSLGLLGEWPSGKMLARDGTTNLSNSLASDFALEWQVRDTEPKLFAHVRAPEYPVQCIAPTKKLGSRLGDSHMRKRAQKACANWKEEDKDECIFDVMATRDVGAAESFADVEVDVDEGQLVATEV